MHFIGIAFDPDNFRLGVNQILAQRAKIYVSLFEQDCRLRDFVPCGSYGVEQIITREKVRHCSKLLQGIHAAGSPESSGRGSSSLSLVDALFFCVND